MNKTEATRYIETVSGTIIGDFQVSAQLYHEGREQGPRFHADNDAQARTKAQEYVEQLKARLGTEYRRLYPNGMETADLGLNERRISTQARLSKVQSLETRTSAPK